MRRGELWVGGGILAVLLAVAGLADVLFPGDPMEMVARPLLWPGEDAGFLLGTDALGRDIAAGIAHGARVSLLIGFVAAGVAVLVGSAVGAVAGFWRGWVDDGLMRVCEVFQSIPQFMLAVVLVAIFSPSVGMIVVAVAVVSWPGVARLVRAEVLGLRERDFVLGCRAVGMGEWRILLTQVLPNAAPVIVVSASVLVASAILMEAALAFLGLGDPNVLSWGMMIGMGRDQLREAWFVIVIPGVALVVTALGLNLVGNGLNAVLRRGR